MSATSQVNSLPPTYASIDKSKKKQVKKEDTKHTAAKKKDPSVAPYTKKVASGSAHKAGGKDDPTNRRQ